MSRRISTLVLVVMIAVTASAESERPSMRSEKPFVKYRIDGVEHKYPWNLAPDLKPDLLVVDVEEGQTVEVCFFSDVDEFCRATDLGDTHDVDIVHNGIAHFNRIEGRKRVPAAVFSQEYMKANRDKITVLIPEVYELVNVAIALTEVGRTDKWLVVKTSDYYSRLLEYFADHLEHPFVRALNVELAANRNRYSRLKMNGYAFEYDDEGEIQRSSIYDRTGFASERENFLLPFFEEMRAFSSDTKFREFYRQEQATYAEQIRVYEEEIDLEAMKVWLGKNFPGVDAYDTVKIVFSPLVGGTQSVTWIEQADFRELQPHVNFPYRRMKDAHPQSDAVYRGAIVFTELNHGYINPTADRYVEEIAAAVTDLEFWTDRSKAGGYGSPMSVFGEYMNWGLVGLYVLDRAAAEDQERLLAWLDRFMGERGRGFLRFAEFESFLVDAYRNRSDGETIADLYPAVIQWFGRYKKAETVDAVGARGADSTL